MRRIVIAYLSSLAAIAAAVLLRQALDPMLGDALPFITIFGGVAASMWLAGSGAAIFAAFVGYLAANYLFIAPRNEISVYRLADLVGLAAYAFTCAIIIGFGVAMRRARAKAGERGELMQVTLRSIGDAVVTTDLSARVTYLNAVAEELTGWTLGEALGRPLDDVFRIVGESTREPVANPALRALREGIVVGLANHTVLVRKDGSERPIDDSAAPIRNDQGRISGCVLVFRDVTKQREIEREKAGQLMTARLLAAIVESSDDAIISKSLDGVIQSWNAGAERLFGHTADQACGRHISLVIPEDRRAEEDMIVARLKAGERIEHFETERLRRDGTRVRVSLTISPIRDAAGHVVGASKIARDVTERTRVEMERERLATVIENSTDFIGICDLQGNPFFVNRAGLAMVGLDSLDEARRTSVKDFFFPEDQPQVMGEFFASVLRDGHGEIEIRFRHFKTGAALWMIYKVIVLKDHDERPVALATVSPDITTRKRMEDDLRKIAGELAEAGQRKDEFMATLAHELRNPLAPLVNMLEVLKRADGDPAVLERALTTMERQLGQMVRLVDDLLDLNRISHDRLELRKADVELAGVIAQAIEASRPLVDASRHELIVSLPTEPIWLHADPARLAQVFGNLLNNSCRYTRAGGRIEIGARLDGAHVVVSVKDNGAGIPVDKLEAIFDMFAQVDRPLERAQGGLGIGLTLVKRLVQMHGGSVEAKSDGENRGSEFIVMLPVVQRPVAAAGSAETVPVPTGGLRVLIADDNRDSAESLAMLLAITGNQTYLAHDGFEAMAAAERHRPDVMLLDIGMPKMDGHAVCRRVRGEPWGKDIAMIALTGWGQAEDRRRSADAGFDGHLVKPVDHAALVALLESLQKRKRPADALDPA